MLTKKKNLLAMTAIFAMLALGGSLYADKLNTQSTKPEVKAESDEIDISKLSEAFGNFIGRNLNAPGIKFDMDSIIKGIREGAAGKPAPMSDQEYEMMMAKLQERVYKQLSDDNLKAANDFMTKNAKEKDVKEIEPGKLQFFIIDEGNGPVVTEKDSPLIQYTGKYIDGTIFGSSEDAGGPITIPLSQTIPGFSKGLLGMKEGEKRRLFVHPDLGYGTSGQLPPNSLLIFDVKVIKADNGKKTPELDEEALQADELDGDEEDDDEEETSKSHKTK